MAKIKNARLKDNTWIIDRAVPPDLKPIIGNSRWRISLKTGDVREAGIRAARQNADLDALIKFYRALSPETIKALQDGLGKCGLSLPTGSPSSPSLSQGAKALNAFLVSDKSERRSELEVIKARALFEAIEGSIVSGHSKYAFHSSLYEKFVDRVLASESADVEAARKVVQGGKRKPGMKAPKRSAAAWARS